MVCNKLRRIGEGCWLQDGCTDWLSADSKAGCDGLDLWRSKWCVCLAVCTVQGLGYPFEQRSEALSYCTAMSVRTTVCKCVQRQPQ